MFKKIGLFLLKIVVTLFSLFSIVLGCAGITVANTDKSGVSLILAVFFIGIGGTSLLLLVLWSLKSKQKQGEQATSFINPYVDMIPFTSNTGMPIVWYPDIQMHHGEVLIYAVPASTYMEKEQVVAYRGASSGVSIRVARGLYVRQSASKGSPIRQDVKKFFNGDYIITNQRLLFLGAQKSFDCPVEKVTIAKPIANDAFVIIANGKNYPIVVHQDELIHALTFTNTALQKLQAADFES